VEDLTYEDVSPSRFRAELIGRGVTPQYKDQGFFVFSGLPQGNYTLKLTGERLRPETIEVAVPAQAHIFLESHGDSELIVIAQTVANDPGSPGGRRITFDPLILTRQIRAGARVVSDGLPPNASATLTAPLEVGPVSSARLTNAAGLPANSVVRIIRDRSVRMNLDPYYAFESSITRVVGKVVSQQNAALPLAGARVRVAQLNGAPVTQTNVGGVLIFKGVDAGGGAIVLGAEKDISVVTNERGDYNLYFSNETLASYKITDQTIAALTADGAPQPVLTVLEDGALKDKVFRGIERFLKAVREAMRQGQVSNEILLQRQPSIIQHAENFIRNLTLEATLAGFDPASKTETLNTSQRKVINFELARP
jgi:hypothetical protein